ncbi:MAG: hypothetical protein GF398_09840 [Chitinivibrionales bacterium]|nr:hypothetical protein [Chitinivibrionales bacterium]
MIKHLALCALALSWFAPAQDYLEQVSYIRSILDSNAITGVPIESITKSSEGTIEELDLSNKEVSTSFIKTLTPQIGKLAKLKKLKLAGNELKTLPEEIGNLSELVELDISNNNLTSLPSTIGNLSSLKKLDLRNNELRTFPPALLELKNVWYLHLRGNNLTELPGGITKMSGLKELYLKGNRLKSLPLSVVNLKLDYFEILENKLCDLPDKIDVWLKKNDKQYRDWQKCY